MAQRIIKTALIVDDDHLEREYLSELLIRSGFAVRAAATVPNAAAIARIMRFDCFFIDDRMSGYNGADALKELRRAALAEHGEAPASFLLGDAQDKSAQRFQEDGFTGFLEKPVDMGRLAEIFPGGRMLSEEAPAAAPEADRGDALRIVAGLHTETGIANCGSEENYLSALRIFYHTISAKAEEIERYFTEGDRENYTIKVHALKSSARIIGAESLSEQARELEDAGSRGDLEMIRDKTPALLAAYREFSEKLAPVLAEDDDADERPFADAATLSDAWQSIAEFAEQMDYDLVEMVLKSLEDYRLAQADAEKLARVRSALFALNWEQILREVR